MTDRQLWSRFLHGLWIGAMGGGLLWSSWHGLWMAVLLLIGLGLLGVWLLCLAIKQDQLEAKRDRLDYDPGCDAFSLRGSGRKGRDA
jgi:hypothetical protein